MGKLAVYKYFSFMFLIITFLLMMFTIAGLIGGNVPPAGNTALSMLVYALPLLIIANAVMLVFWLVRRRWHWAAIPLVTLLCCIPYARSLVNYHPAGGQAPADDQNVLNVCSYNVAMFGRETTGFKAEDILSEMKKQQIDVVCFQEYNDISGDKLNSASYKDYFPYMANGAGDMVIYSRYPITQSQAIEFDNTNNSAMWADVDVNGKKLRVFNAHLQTTGINRTLSGAAKMEMQGFNVEKNALLKLIYGNYTRGMLVRASQADLVAAEVKSAGVPCIVCGDFNDVPYSYVYNTMLGQLVDGFKECGNGFMYTFRGNKKVRIDYIFHDKSMRGLSYYRQELSYSDHFPVFMKLEL